MDMKSPMGEVWRIWRGKLEIARQDHGRDLSRDLLGQTRKGGNGLMRENISPSNLVAQWEHKPQQSL